MEKQTTQLPPNYVLVEETALENLILKCVRKELYNLKTKNEGEEDRILSVEEVMLILGVKRQTIYSYTHRNIISYYKYGKKLYFKQSDIDKWLNDGRRQSVFEINEKANNYLNRKAISQF